ncbi:MAG: MOSC domain-containing protein [Pseudomonadota bacterium]
MGDRGVLKGIARRSARKVPMETCSFGEITLDAGLIGDHKGLKFKKRAVTVLAIEDWHTALNAVVPPAVEGDAALASADGAVPLLDWTTRRANLLVEGVELPKAAGGRLRIGSGVELEVTYPCQPCRRMDQALPGLLKALHPDWRGGLAMKVLSSGRIDLGDPVIVTKRPERRVRRLP